MSLAVLAHGFDDGTEFVLRNGRIFPTRHLLTHSDHLATGSGRPARIAERTATTRLVNLPNCALSVDCGHRYGESSVIG
jgi:hypothetical protein